MSETVSLPTGKRLLTFHQAPQVYPGFTQGALRWLRFNNTNGFNACIICVGRKLLIDADAFEHWLEEHRDGGIAGRIELSRRAAAQASALSHVGD
jgi:hypothetical protein